MYTFIILQSSEVFVGVVVVDNTYILYVTC